MSTVSGSVAAAVLCLLVAPPSPLFAQDLPDLPVPLVDVSAGYTLLRDTSHDRNFPAGWYFSGAVNPNQWLGIVGEVTDSYARTEETTFAQSQYSSKNRVSTIMAGPRFFRKVGRVVPFGQFLAGVAVERRESTSLWNGISSSGSTTTNRFALQPGAGVTVYLTERVGLRAAVDYRSMKEPDETEFTSAVRVVTGFTLQWGGR